MHKPFAILMCAACLGLVVSVRIRFALTSRLHQMFLRASVHQTVLTRMSLWRILQCKISGDLYLPGSPPEWAAPTVPWGSVIDLKLSAHGHRPSPFAALSCSSPAASSSTDRFRNCFGVYRPTVALECSETACVSSDPDSLRTARATRTAVCCSTALTTCGMLTRAAGLSDRVRSVLCHSRQASPSVEAG